MIALGNYKAQTWRTILVTHLSVAALGALVWFVFGHMMGMPAIAVVVIELVVAGGASTSISWWLSQRLTAPIELLTQAIAHVDPKSNDTPAPDITVAIYGRQLLNEAIGTVYDIAGAQHKTDQKLLNEHDYMAALLAAIPMPVMVLDTAQKIRYHNQAAAQLVGDKVQMVVSEPFDKIFNLAFTESLTLTSWLEKSKAETVKATHSWDRVKMTMPDQTKKLFDMIASYSKNDSHGLETILIFFDHTQLYASDEAEVSFVSLAAHELRTPIAALRGYIEMFEDEIGPTLDPEQKQFMYKMTVSAAQLSTFVNNILSVVRIDNDQMNVHLREENWLEAIKSAAQDFALRASVRNRKLFLKLPATLPTVAADRVSIYEVLSNLIDNAIKYSPDGGQITVSSYEKDGMVETTVQDNGIGIPASVIDKLFDKFYRSHRSKESVGGTGLGLFLCKSIVEAHGGNIWVRSTEGQGATFTFTLPIYASVADKLKTSDNDGGIIRGAHGWIKNHSMYRR